MKMSEVHECTLPVKDSYGLPKLAPNVGWTKRLLRSYQRQIVPNPDNHRCRSFYVSKAAIVAEQRRHVSSRYSYIIHPFSNLNAFLETAFFLVWMSRMIYMPLLNNFPGISVRFYHLDTYVSFLLQPTLIVSIFFMGYIDTTVNEVVLEQKKVSTRYLKRYFLFDVISTNMFENLCRHIIVLSVKNDRQMEILLYRTVAFLCTTCLYMRIYSILHFLSNVAKFMRVGKTLRDSISLLIKTGMYIHFLTCMLYLVPQIVYGDEWPEDSWLVKADIHSEADVPLYRRYGECFLMTACNFFGASAGKYDTDQMCEQFSLCLVRFSGRLYTLFLLADVLGKFGVVGTSQSDYERRVADMRQYMLTNDLPESMKTRIVSYYETKMHGHYFDEREILNTLSDGLKMEMCLFSARRLIKKSEFLKHLPPISVTELMSLMRQETFAPGNVLFKPEDPGDSVYFVSSGTVAIVTCGGLELCHFEDGDIFGLLLTEGTRIYVCVSVETTDVFIMKYKKMMEFLKPFPEAIEYLKRIIGERKLGYLRTERLAHNPTDSVLVELEAGRLLAERATRYRAK